MHLFMESYSSLASGRAGQGGVVWDMVQNWRKMIKLYCCFVVFWGQSLSKISGLLDQPCWLYVLIPLQQHFPSPEGFIQLKTG